MEDTQNYKYASCHKLKINRDSSLTNKSLKGFWCSNCDADRAQRGAKCPTCGKPNGRKCFKK